MRSRKKNIISDSTFEISSLGISKNDFSGKRLWRWDRMKSAVIRDEYLRIKLSEGNKLYIPFNRISNNESIEATIKFIQENIKKYGGGDKAKTGRNFYKLGWFGLIPLWGIFVGVYLFKFGREYKDPILKRISISTFIYQSFFLIVFISVSISISNFIPGIRKYQELIIQKDINFSCKDIEFYKTKKGVYPDSITQLLDIDSASIVFEPMFNSNAKKVPFSYKKIGNKYILFSKGLDKIPHTSDDIYPGISPFDTTKIGLIVDTIYLKDVK